MMDPQCSTIDRVYDDNRAHDEHDNPDLSASFRKNIGEIYRDFQTDRITERNGDTMGTRGMSSEVSASGKPGATLGDLIRPSNQGRKSQEQLAQKRSVVD